MSYRPYPRSRRSPGPTPRFVLAAALLAVASLIPLSTAAAGTSVGRALLSSATDPPAQVTPSAAAPPAVGDARPFDPRAIVRVFTQPTYTDPLSPWQRSPEEEVTGSGAVLPGRRILTNAHVVSGGVMIEVKRQGMPRRVLARLEHVCHPCDLALLRVEDGKFFQDVEPLELGPLPSLQQRVEVYGFPIGGESISVTSGVVSRVEVGTYAHSLEHLLLAQIDAAINPGNSGGPALSRGRVVGIASQMLVEAENVGYIVPTPIIEHFLHDVEDGRFDGFPRLGVEVQPVENPALRARLGIPDGETGALVLRVNYGSPAWNVLDPGSVLLQVDGTPISEDLSVPVEAGHEVDFSHLVYMHQMGEEVRLRMLQDGNPTEIGVRLSPWTPLVPTYRHDPAPDYFVYAGLVFQPLRAEYLAMFDERPPGLARYFYEDNVVTPDRQQVVVISHVLKHPVNKGYAAAQDAAVAAVNGTRPRDLRHLVELLDGAAGPWVEITMEDGMRLVLDVGQVRASAAEVLRMYGVPTDRGGRLRGGRASPR